MRLAALRTLLTVTPGEKIAYVTDAADTAAKSQHIRAREQELEKIEVVGLHAHR